MGIAAALLAALVVWIFVVTIVLDLVTGGSEGGTTETSVVSAIWLEPHPARTASTLVTVSSATRADVGAVQPIRPGIGELTAQLRFVKVAVVHRLALAAGDPLLRVLRSGAAADNVDAFTRAGFGVIYGADQVVPIAYDPPALGVVRSGANVTLSGSGFVSYPVDDPFVGLEFGTDEVGTPLGIASQIVDVMLDGWTVAGSNVSDPLDQTPHSLRVPFGDGVRVALVRDGSRGLTVTDYLRDGFHRRPDAALSSASGRSPLNAIAELGLILATWFGLIRMIIGIQAKGWTRRRPELLMIALAVGSAAVLVAGKLADAIIFASFLVLLYALPAGTLRYAAHKVGGPAGMTPRRWKVIFLCALAATGWAIGVLLGLPAAIPFWLVILVLAIVVVQRVPRAAVAATLAWAVAITAMVAAAFDNSTIAGPAVVAVPVAWALTVVAAVAVATGRWSRAAAIVTCVATAVAWGLTFTVFGDYRTTMAGAFNFGGDVLGVMTTSFPVVVVVLLVLRLRRIGQRAEATALGTAYASAVVVLMVLYLGPAEGTIGSAALLVWAGLAWLLPPREDTVTLAAVTPGQHHELVEAALRRRFLRSAKVELFRTGRSRIAASDLTVAAFDEQRAVIDAALAERYDRINPDLAFGTSGGRSPWENGVVSFAVALLLTLPIALIHQWPLGTSAVSVLYASRALFTLPFLGFVFGFFYPRVRGTSPLGKALRLGVVALGVELSTYLLNVGMNDLDARQKLSLLVIVIGQCALFSLGLGLLWEWRLTALAGESWARIRSGRSVQAVLAPVVAVLLAFGTTIATSLAGSAVTELLRPAPLPTATTSPEPGPTGH
jgi:hypothetical protein